VACRAVARLRNLGESMTVIVSAEKFSDLCFQETALAALVSIECTSSLSIRYLSK
jgi:hypothetical protein